MPERTALSLGKVLRQRNNDAYGRLYLYMYFKEYECMHLRSVSLKIKKNFLKNKATCPEPHS